MAAETTSKLSGRPRSWLLAALAVAVVIAAAPYLSPEKSAAPRAEASNRRTPTRGKATPETVQPADLDVRLDELKQPRPATQPSERNPFRFYVPPPPPPVASPGGGRGGLTAPPVNPEPIGPPPPPPIPLKFIGVLDVPNMGKLAVFSDCRTTMRGREGELIDGRYRLVRIGVESVVMEYADGGGRTTIRMSGQECVGK